MKLTARYALTQTMDSRLILEFLVIAGFVLKRTPHFYQYCCLLIQAPAAATVFPSVLPGPTFDSKV